MDLICLCQAGVSPAGLSQLTPLVAVCVIFAALLSGLMIAFLNHLSTKDQRTADLVQGTRDVLTSMSVELTRLADNDRYQTEVLQAMLTSCRSCKDSPLFHNHPALSPRQGIGS